MKRVLRQAFVIDPGWCWLPDPGFLEFLKEMRSWACSARMVNIECYFEVSLCRLHETCGGSKKINVSLK